jgi:hypothetical protein
MRMINKMFESTSSRLETVKWKRIGIFAFEFILTKRNKNIGL